MKVSAAYLERVAREYQAAYAAANEETAPAITWQRGWFIIGNRPSFRYRRTAIEEMRDELRRRATAGRKASGLQADR